MSTSPSALYPNYYTPGYGGTTVGFNNTTNPVKAAQNQRAVVQSQGDVYQNIDQQLADEYAAQQGGTQAYLNPLEESNASGQGGYTADQASQIELSPQDKQNIITGAGISSGVNTAASVGAAERAANAAGGNPEALATYRARAAQTQGANAGNAETAAAVQAQQAGSQGAQAVGNATLNEENQGLGYLSNLQAQQGSQAQNEQGLGQGAYGTETAGTGAATGQSITAAQLPTTTDKIIGTAAGVAGAALLADGTPEYYGGGGQEAILGEDGPEAIVKAASDPVRSNTTFMADGGPAHMMDAGGIVPASTPGITPPAGTLPTWLQNYLSNAGKNNTQPASPAPGAPGWNKTTPYQQLGTAIGTAFKPMVQKGLNGGNGGGISGGGGTSSFGGSGGYGSFAPSTGPSSSIPAQNNAARLPGGLVNRTGDAINGVPSLGGSAVDAAGAGADAIGSGTEDLGEGAADVGEGLGAGAADVAGIFAADGHMPYLEDGEMSHEYARGSSMMAEGHMGSGFHWSERQPKMLHTPHQIPLGYRGKQMMADGGMQPSSEAPAEIITSPTRVRLDSDDMVVPLSFRPKAKVRPSAAMPALNAMRQGAGRAA